MKYFPHTKEDIEQMLAVAGLKSIDDLFAEIPEQLMFNRICASRGYVRGGDTQVLRKVGRA